MRPNTKNIRKEIRAITKHRDGTRAESVPERLELLKAEKQPAGASMTRGGSASEE